MCHVGEPFEVGSSYGSAALSSTVYGCAASTDVLKVPVSFGAAVATDYINWLKTVSHDEDHEDVDLVEGLLPCLPHNDWATHSG